MAVYTTDCVMSEEDMRTTLYLGLLEDGYHVTVGLFGYRGVRFPRTVGVRLYYRQAMDDV